MSRRARRSGAMHVVTNTIRRGDRVYMAHLLRRSYREGGQVKKETLANLSHLPEEVIELIRGALRGQRYVAAGGARRGGACDGAAAGASAAARPDALAGAGAVLGDDRAARHRSRLEAGD